MTSSTTITTPPPQGHALNPIALLDIAVGSIMAMTPFVVGLCAFANAHPKNVVIQALWHSLMPDDFWIRTYVGSLVDEAVPFGAFMLLLSGIWAAFSLWQTRFRVYSFVFMVLFATGANIAYMSVDPVAADPSFAYWLMIYARAACCAYLISSVFAGLLIVNKHRKA